MSTNFKTCMFGGFDRADVIAFIEKTARESQERITALERENEELKKSQANKDSELFLLRQQAVAEQEELQSNEELSAQLASLQERCSQLEQEAESLRAQAADYQSLKDHIAEIEISAHRRTEEFRAEAVAKLRESIDRQRDWCEKSRAQYTELSEQFAQKLYQAQQMLSAPDMSGFDRMSQELQALSDSFDE